MLYVYTCPFICSPYTQHCKVPYPMMLFCCLTCRTLYLVGVLYTRDLDTSVEAKNEVSPTPHPLSTSITKIKDSEADKIPAERKPGVFHAVDNSKQKEQKQTTEYTEDTQGNSKCFEW